MYRSGVKPWQSAGWKPSVKLFHDKVNSIEGIQDTDKKESNEI